MKFRFEVMVTLKDDLLDPQGKAVEGSLPAMGWTNVSNVRVGKHITFDLDAPDIETADRQGHDMATRLLSNPVIEDVVLQWEGEDGADGTHPVGALLEHSLHLTSGPSADG